MNSNSEQYSRRDNWITQIISLMNQFSPIQLEKVAHYSVSSTRIVFNYEDPDRFSIPYNLDDASFQKNLHEINKAMMWFHEVTHYIQGWSTTNGILENIALMYKYDQLSGIQKKNVEYKLPLMQYFQELALKFPSMQENELRFFDLFAGYLAHVLNYSWLTGSLLPDVLEAENGQPFSKETSDYFTRKVRLSNIRELDQVLGFEDKSIGVFLCRAFGSDSYYTLGTMHLTECFAKTVEFEHLLHFNKKYGKKYILSWLFDEERAIYNLPIHLWEYILKEAKYKKEIPFTWAHMRIFIDIAMMYSDLLDTDYQNFSDGQISMRVANLKVQPGIIFSKVLQAFLECYPLIDHERDILRLYDELCGKLDIPSLKEMLENIIRITHSLNEQDFIKDSLIGASFLGVAEKLLIAKHDDPILFINDLIYPPRFEEITHIVKDHMAIHTPKTIKERDDVSTIAIDMTTELYNQLLTESEVICPRFIVINRLLNENEQLLECIGENSGGKYCKECDFAPFVEIWLKNERRIE